MTIYMRPLLPARVVCRPGLGLVLALASCGGGGGGSGGAVADSGVSAQLRGALGDFKLLQTPERDLVLDGGRLVAETYGGQFMAFGLSEGRVLGNGSIQFCDVVASPSDQGWTSLWDGGTAVASAYQFASGVGDVGGFNVWVARSLSTQPSVMRGKYFSRPGGVFDYDPYRWDIDGYVHLTDGVKFLSIDRGSSVVRGYDVSNLEGEFGVGFIERPIESGREVVIGEVDQNGSCLHYVLDAAGNIVSGRRYDLGWPSGLGGFRNARIDRYGGGRYVVRYQFDSFRQANFVFNASHQL